MENGSIEVRASSAYEALAFHALAHLSLAPPRSIRDPRYLAWCRETLPVEAIWPLDDDAPTLSARIEADRAADAVQWLPLLHADMDALHATTHLELDAHAIAPHCGSTPLAALRARRGDGIEWLRADLLLIATAFGHAYAEAPPVHAQHLEEVRVLLSALPAPEVPTAIVLDHALGAHGRSFPHVVYAGAPAAWNGLDARTPAVIALHEHAVRRAHGSFEEREWRALVRVARLIRACDPLARAHAEWLASAAIDALVESACARGEITRADAARVMEAVDRSRAIALVSG